MAAEPAAPLAKPSFLKLLNGIALAEAGAGVFLSAWADTTPDPAVEKTLRMVAMRETEHAYAFEKRIMELGFNLKRPAEETPNPLLAVVTDPALSDCAKMEKAGFDKEPDASKPDAFSNMFDDKELDPVTGSLLGRYIAEERDSGRAFRACYAATKAKQPSAEAAAPADGAAPGGLVGELERLSKLHAEDCLTADEFAAAKQCLLAGAKL